MQTFGGDVVHPHDICYFLHFTNSEVVVYLKVVIHVLVFCKKKKTPVSTFDTIVNHVLVLYGHCPNSFRPPPLCQTGKRGK